MIGGVAAVLSREEGCARTSNPGLEVGVFQFRSSRLIACADSKDSLGAIVDR
jgi:hypothetical protein